MPKVLPITASSSTGPCPSFLLEKRSPQMYIVIGIGLRPLLSISESLLETLCFYVFLANSLSITSAGHPSLSRAHFTASQTPSTVTFGLCDGVSESL